MQRYEDFLKWQYVITKKFIFNGKTVLTLRFFVVLQERLDSFVEVAFKEVLFALAVDFKLAFCFLFGFLLA